MNFVLDYLCLLKLDDEIPVKENENLIKGIIIIGRNKNIFQTGTIFLIGSPYFAYEDLEFLNVKHEILTQMSTDLSPINNLLRCVISASDTTHKNTCASLQSNINTHENSIYILYMLNNLISQDHYKNSSQGIKTRT